MKRKRKRRKIWKRIKKVDLIITCSRGHTNLWRNCKPIKTQHLPNEIIELRNCPNCRTTLGRSVYSTE